MRRDKLFILILLTSIFFSCEKEITPDLETTDPQILVDAFITDQPAEQVIRVANSLPYFNSSTLPPVRNAVVEVRDDQGAVYQFVEKNEAGFYVWTPPASDSTFGRVGGEYFLEIRTGNSTITASVTMGRVPEIDTIEFLFEEESPFNAEGYVAEFFAVDPIGPGDTYWIKTFKNGSYLNLPSEINVAYDAAFSAGSNVDGQNFILPIRRSVNPLDENDDGSLKAAYLPGDSIRVEIHSISEDAFNFFLQAQEQIDRPGGFGELFAVPLANLPTNLEATHQWKDRVVGFFNVAAVSQRSNWLDPDNLPPRNP